jgi:hypothetical protein
MMSEKKKLWCDGPYELISASRVGEQVRHQPQRLSRTSYIFTSNHKH